jgi:hypothetical protein
VRRLADWYAVRVAGDPPPAAVVGAAKTAFAHRGLPVDRAVLVEEGRAGCGPAAVRVLRFRLDEPDGEQGLCVELVLGPGARALSGRVVPARPGRVRLQPDGGDPVALVMDAGGRFGSDAVPRGPLRVLVDRPGRRPVATEWLLPG